MTKSAKPKHRLTDKAFLLLGWDGPVGPGFGPYIRMSKFEEATGVFMYRRVFDDAFK